MAAPGGNAPRSAGPVTILIRPAGPQEGTGPFRSHPQVRYMPSPQVPSVLDAACPSRRLLDLVARKWTALVICVLGGGTLRSGELRARVGGVSQKVLTQTLRLLE